MSRVASTCRAWSGATWRDTMAAPHVALFLILCLVHGDTKTVQQDKLGEYIIMLTARLFY